MDWKDIAGPLAKIGLGTLGTVIGGPAGGALGGLLGQAAASALGVEATPEAVKQAIESDPSAAEKLAEVEASAAQYAAQQVAEVNATMRAEIAGGSLYQRSWRPLAGYALSALTAAFGACFIWSLVLMILYHDHKTLGSAIEAVSAFLMIVTPLGAVSGVTAWGRSKEKAAATIGGLDPAIIGHLIKAMGRAR